MQLKFPMNRLNFDMGCDQGYASERSPEDELPPSLPILSIPYQIPEQQNFHHHQLPLQEQQQQIKWDFDQVNEHDFSFITNGKCTLHYIVYSISSFVVYLYRIYAIQI